LKILCLNTYAGSLLVGARAGGHEVVGSYEDVGFGQHVARANFPDVDHRPSLADWPDASLDGVTVIAHPPCSAFSTQNIVWHARGTGSGAFSCTHRVVDYATKHRASAVAVESVMGALRGAWDEHQFYADERGYDLYRVLQSGAAFGAQWRDRFWAIFIKRPARRDLLTLGLVPLWKRVRDVVRGEGPSFEDQDRMLEKLKKKLRDGVPGYDAELDAFLFLENHPRGGMGNELTRHHFPGRDRYEVLSRYVTTFSSGQMVYLDPMSYSPTLLGGSWWYMNGRNLSVADYQAIAGFPSDYAWPDKTVNQARMFMSKGVIPAVATWVLDQVERHLSAEPIEVDPAGWGVAVRPNGIADLRIKRKDWNPDGPLPPTRQKEWE
jgi:site-specific DNA-cytosine methylase